jgi:hypothetical protein
MAYPFSAPFPEYGLAGQANQFMSGQANLALSRGLPGAGGLMRQSSQNILGLLRGQVPEDVTQQIQQRGAERGVAMGSPGSPNANAAWLRALGLTSLGLQQQGEQNLTGAVQRTPIPEIWNPLSLYVPERTALAELQATQMKPNQIPGMWSSPASQFSVNRWTSPAGF